MDAEGSTDFSFGICNNRKIPNSLFAMMSIPTEILETRLIFLLLLAVPLYSVP